MVSTNGSQPATITARPETRREHVRLDTLRPNPWQPRGALDQAHIREIADSIASVGLLQLPMARPGGDNTFEIAFGHARVEAIRLLASEGRWPWPGIDVQVRDLSDAEMALIALSENTKRKDLAPLETYRAWRKALEIQGLTQESLAAGLGIARPTLTNALRVLALPQVVLERVDSGELSVHGARELLCLQAADHAHVDIMEEVIGEIAGSSYGIAPDWRIGNVRRKIARHVGAKTTQVWRHLGPAEYVGQGVHGHYGANFDVAAFEGAFPLRIHLIPDDEPGKGSKERTLRWTCAVKEWKQWQDKVKRAAQTEMGGMREDPAAAELRAVLLRDPLGREVMGEAVSVGTIVRQVIESRQAGTPQESQQQEAEEAQEARDEEAGYRRLNARLGALIQGWTPGSLAWSSLQTEDIAERLMAELSLAEYGLDVGRVHAALGNFVQGVEAEIARKTPAPGLGMTPEVKASLGTRGEPMLNLSNTKVWHQSLAVGQYGGPPSYFPDVKECLERCVIGARYGKANTYQGVGLVCTNAEHFKLKLELGKEQFKERVAQVREGLAARDGPIAGALEERFDMAGAYAVAQALLLTGSWGKATVDEARDFGFEPPMLAMAREALGVKASTNPWECFGAAEMLGALEEHPEQATLVAASLTIHVIGAKDAKRLALLAQRLGIVMAKKAEEKGKKRRDAKKAAAPMRPTVLEGEEEDD